MRKKMFKIIALILLLVLILPIAAYAGGNDISPDADKGDPGVDSKDVQGVIDFLVTLLKYFTAIGGVVVVGALVYNGYKLAFSTDPKGKADAMDGLKYAVIGGIIAFGAYRFAGVLKGLADKL
jgi:hypothetical protein